MDIELQPQSQPSGQIRSSNIARTNNIVKSPSDTTIYAPALQRIERIPTLNPVVNSINEGINQSSQSPAPGTNQSQIDNITKFIEGIRVQSVVVDKGHQKQANRSDNEEATDQHQLDPTEEARSKADKLIAEVEQFKATLNTPQGILNKQNYTDGFVKEDDEFFHITCHVDAVTISCIQRGNFIDLDKLLPQNRAVNADSEPKSELVFREGCPVIVPHMDKSQCITNVRKWEQAFRVYAAVYSQANPSRGPEIWQYVYTINHTANAYSWANVVEYDFAFRQMMAVNPARKWSKIYQQMWTMCMTDPHKNSFNHNRGSYPSGGGHYNHISGSKGNASTKSKPDFCWKFNKGKCKFGGDCKFVHHCSYCDGTGHGNNSCPTKVSAAANSSKKDN